MRSAISTYRTPVLVIAAGRSRARNDMPFPAGSSACCESIGRRGGCGGVEGTTSNHASNCQVAPPMPPPPRFLAGSEEGCDMRPAALFAPGRPAASHGFGFGSDRLPACEKRRVSRRRGGTVAASRGLIVLKKLIPNIVEYDSRVYITSMPRNSRFEDGSRRRLGCYTTLLASALVLVALRSTAGRAQTRDRYVMRRTIRAICAQVYEHYRRARGVRGDGLSESATNRPHRISLLSGRSALRRVGDAPGYCT